MRAGNCTATGGSRDVRSCVPELYTMGKLMIRNLREDWTASCAKTRSSRHQRKNCASRNQAQTLARERVTQ